MRAIILTSDKSIQMLPGYAHLHNKYWSADQEVLVAGFTPPDFDLPSNFEFMSLGAFKDYPVNRWSNALIALLQQIPDELFIWTMDDFWLVRDVDTEAIGMLEAWMRAHPDVARMDLSTDRLYAPHAGDVESLGRLDLIASHRPVPYLLSFQAGIWRRDLLLKYLVADESPWQVELDGTKRMNDDGALVYGTRQAPMRYLIALQNGKLAIDGGYQQPAPVMRGDDLSFIVNQGLLKE